MAVYLKEPSLEEYWYQEKILNDPLTMEYNAGWDVSYNGYDYETGCIKFGKEKWESEFNKRQESNIYYAYIVREEDNEFVGTVNFGFNEKKNQYTCGIVIEYSHRGKGYGKKALKLLCDIAFNEYNVDSLYNGFDKERSSIKIFGDLGFKITKEYTVKRFNKDIKVIEVCLKRSEWNE